jgi:hypothetical protein
LAGKRGGCSSRAEEFSFAACTRIAAELLREGPYRLGRGGRNRAKVAAVERRRLIWVHEKDLVVGNHPTACPSWKGAPRAVALVRRSNSGSIEVAALVEEGCKRLGRHDDDERATDGLLIGRTR